MVNLLQLLPKELYIFLISMVPIIELRGAIPLGVGLGIPWLQNYLISVVGNFLPVPFILLFIRRIIRWMSTNRYLSKISNWLENKFQKKSSSVMKYATFGLLLFVAVPLPGTGAWTGALIAAMLNMRYKYALPSIFAGVVIAGALVTAISCGFLSFLEIFIK